MSLVVVAESLRIIGVSLGVLGEILRAPVGVFEGSVVAPSELLEGPWWSMGSARDSRALLKSFKDHCVVVTY